MVAKHRLIQWLRVNRLSPFVKESLLIVPVATLFVLAVNLTGIFQIIEWSVLDQFFRLRPLESVDRRITIITISEADISKIGQWPVPDAVLSQAIEILKSYQPRVIGVDLYRDLPIEPGHAALVKTYQTTPNLLGVEKAVGMKVPPPPALVPSKQVGIADVILDEDGKVRRGLLSVQSEKGELKFGLATKAALKYLEHQGIVIQDLAPGEVQLGRARFTALSQNDGGYVRASAGGYQVLLNFRGSDSNFQAITLQDVLLNRIPPDLVHDRILFLGAVAPSTNDLFRTPYDSKVTQSKQTPGVYLHATLASQIISAALDGRSLIRVWPDFLEGLWALGWGYMGFLTVQTLIRTQTSGNFAFAIWFIVAGVGVGSLLFGVNYLLFLSGWWLPIVPACLALGISATASIVTHAQRLQGLAHVDGLTQIMNRRYFDMSLRHHLLEHQPVSLILCDVDYFKRYNDTYGHQAGDVCLQKVARALTQSVRVQDVVARYGGEEFAVILPSTSLDFAAQIAERIRVQVNSLELPHETSTTSPFVSLSCGVASSETHLNTSIAELLSYADTALYRAKQKGRNCIVLLPSVSIEEFQ